MLLQNISKLFSQLTNTEQVHIQPKLFESGNNHQEDNHFQRLRRLLFFVEHVRKYKRFVTNQAELLELAHFEMCFCFKNFATRRRFRFSSSFRVSLFDSLPNVENTTLCILSFPLFLQNKGLNMFLEHLNFVYFERKWNELEILTRAFHPKFVPNFLNTQTQPLFLSHPHPNPFFEFTIATLQHTVTQLFSCAQFS